MIVAVDSNIPLLAGALAPCAQVREFTGRSLTREALSDVDILFVRSTTRVNDHLLEGTPVRCVGTATAGIDHIDTGWLASRGIRCADAAGCNAASVAEYVVYAAIEWALARGRSLRGTTLGIVGFGHVGRLVAFQAHRLGMTLLVNDPPRILRGGGIPAFCRHTELSVLVEQSDIVTLHVPLERGGDFPTYRLFSHALLAALPPGSLLVQASRGGVVDECALLALVEAGHCTAALDVWEREPVPDARLVQACRLATPHIAGHTYEGKLRGSLMMAAAFAEWTGCQPAVEGINEALCDTTAPVLPADEEALYALLRERRRLHEDDTALRSFVHLPPDECAAHFDTYRNRYPRRRETLPVPLRG